MLIILLIFSLFSLLHLTLGLFQFRKYPTNDTLEHSFSIIIVAHNEEKMIQPLIESLTLLDYPRELLEIIIVDDNSTDNTWSLINNLKQQIPYMKILKTDPKYKHFRGKKAGLQTAIDIAKNELIAFTDADATLPDNWLKVFNRSFTLSTAMVIGYIRGINIVGFQRYKRIFSSGLFASLSGIGRAFSCSGGNMAVRRKVLLEVGGYTKIKSFPSGDDKQMLNLIRKTDYKIVYSSKNRVVERERELSKSQVYQQALRHYGKFSLSSFSYQIAFIFIAFFYLSLPIISFFQPLSLFLFWLGNFSFYICSCLLHKEKLFFEDILLSLLYPYYMLYFSFLGTFTEAKWKK